MHLTVYVGPCIVVTDCLIQALLTLGSQSRQEQE